MREPNEDNQPTKGEARETLRRLYGGDTTITKLEVEKACERLKLPFPDVTIGRDEMDRSRAVDETDRSIATDVGSDYIPAGMPISQLVVAIALVTGAIYFILWLTAQ